jgi:succinyl-CoA synthetase alpha subunit
MAILIDETTKVVVSGITGREGTFHSGQMLAYGTQVVAGVTPGKGGQTWTSDDGKYTVPVFNTVAEAVEKTRANAHFVVVPPKFAADSIIEGADAGCELIVCITDGLAQQDMITATDYVKRVKRTRIIPQNIFLEGPVGLVSRSGTLTYEIVDALTRAGLGQTTAVGIGGDPILGMRFADVLELFENDPATKAVVMVGEIGGSDEEAGAEVIKRMTKPVIGFIGGRSAPPGKRMGHAGAIVSGTSGSADSKIAALNAAGAPVADTTADIPGLVKKALGI